ncbi:MAG: glycosyltransferase, partial [Gammaproteobacteria bacterium]|nr:glycosyltransferase [Gammaproteobacteria bacterium]NIO62386.1 glycosyltransferase [Gammaproteobacteria bacterium]
YQLADSRIRLISRENRGLIATLNEGLELARGKYIARMDADDI